MNEIKNDTRLIIKGYKKRIKELQRRLNTEQYDSKRLTMLLELCKPHINGVLRDIIDEEVSHMRYRYSYREWITIKDSINH